jgi:hypothetical protein
MTFKIDPNFQTPPVVCHYMANMAADILGGNVGGPNLFSVLEPTPGLGSLKRSLENFNFNVWAPEGDFWGSLLERTINKYDAVVMNPPYNPMKELERFVNRGMELSDNVIALLPYHYLVNSERRVTELMDFGLVSITHLPRKTFPGCRVQVAIFELKKGYAGKTEFKRFSW